MKVKIINDCYCTELEKRINEFIENENFIIEDIKYQDGNSCYSVLIVYYEID